MLIEVLSRTGKEILDCEAGLGRSFKALMDIVAFGEFDCAVKRDLALLLQLSLVSNEIDAHIFSGVLLNFLKPVHQRHEGLVARDVVSEEYAVGASVEDSCYALETFLTGGVPNLDLDNLIVDRQVVAAELNSNSDLVLLFKFVIHHALHEARLADACVSDNDELEEMVVLSKGLVLDNLKGHILKLVDLILLHNFIFIMKPSTQRKVTATNSQESAKSRAVSPNPPITSPDLPETTIGDVREYFLGLRTQEMQREIIDLLAAI